jgi:hypothetical protein
MIFLRNAGGGMEVFRKIAQMWDINMWAMIISNIFTAIFTATLTFVISRKILKRQLKAEFWREKLKEIEVLLDLSLEQLDKGVPIFMSLKEYGYSINDFVSKAKIDDLALSNKGLRDLLSKYTQFIDNYNNEYFNLPILDPFEKNKNQKAITDLVAKYKGDFVNLRKEIKMRIERICT